MNLKINMPPKRGKNFAKTDNENAVDYPTNDVNFKIKIDVSHGGAQNLSIKYDWLHDCNLTKINLQEYNLG